MDQFLWCLFVGHTFRLKSTLSHLQMKLVFIVHFYLYTSVLRRCIVVPLSGVSFFLCCFGAVQDNHLGWPLSSPLFTSLCYDCNTLGMSLLDCPYSHVVNSVALATAHIFLNRHIDVTLVSLPRRPKSFPSLHYSETDDLQSPQHWLHREAPVSHLHIKTPYLSSTLFTFCHQILVLVPLSSVGLIYSLLNDTVSSIGIACLETKWQYLVSGW